MTRSHTRRALVLVAAFAMLAVTNAGGDDAAEGTDDAIRALIERFDAAFGEGG